MPNPTPRDVHVDRPLTNISVAFMQKAEAFIADKAFPIVPVAKQSDRYFIYDRRDFFRDEATLRAPGEPSAGGGFRIDNTPTYLAQKFAFHMDVDDDLIANADPPVDPRKDAVAFVTQKLLLRREIAWATSYFAAGIWATNLTGVAAGPVAGEFLQWNLGAATPITDISAQIIAVAALTGFRPNTLVLGPRVYDRLRNHPTILDRILHLSPQPGSVGVVADSQLASILGVDRILVPWAVRDTSAELAAADATDFIFGRGALLCYVPPAPSLLTPSAGYIFSWTGLLGAGAYGNRIKTFRLEERNAERIEGEIAFDARVVSAALGVFFATAVA